MQITMEGATDTGMVRPHNEDSLFCDQDLGLCLVADGMGGQLAGEVASQMAIEMIRDTLVRFSDSDLPLTLLDETLSPAAGRLCAGIRLANRRIFESGLGNPEWHNMGTTVVAGLLDGPQLIVAHVGDSRCYLLRGGSLCQLTDDHSLVAEQLRQGLLSKEEAETSRVRNIITRALGAAPDVEIDLSEITVMPGDRFLLCSDGLTNMASDDEILAILEMESDPATACAHLIRHANTQGGKDNITALILAVDEG